MVSGWLPVDHGFLLFLVRLLAFMLLMHWGLLLSAVTVWCKHACGAQLIKQSGISKAKDTCSHAVALIHSFLCMCTY